ncbi:hypothetical protein [Marivirga sp.]|uniref:hypothetical protein n=1 Tax=Marivirga sp. TaxID=2018662 RepID=UPI003DA760B8
MKKTIILLLGFSILVFLTGCEDVEFQCLSGEVIGKIRSSGGGLAVSLDQDHEQAVSWQGEKNVIVLLNIPDNYQSSGTTIFFTSRPATVKEKGHITDDGDESIELVLYGLEFNDNECP